MTKANPLRAFETKRLDARQLTEADFLLLHTMNQNTVVMATLGGVCDENETKNRLAWNLKQWADNGFGLWLFFEKNSQDFVGRGGIRRLEIDGKEEIEVAYALMPNFWNRGFATEITKKCLEIGFEHYHLLSLVAGTQSTNKPSRRVMEKAGFVFEKEALLFNTPSVIYRINRINYLN